MNNVHNWPLTSYHQPLGKERLVIGIHIVHTPTESFAGRIRHFTWYRSYTNSPTPPHTDQSTTLYIQKRNIIPDIFITQCDQEPPTGGKAEIRFDDGVPILDMRDMQRYKEFRVF